MRSVLIAAAVALATLLAGCSGGHKPAAPAKGGPAHSAKTIPGMPPVDDPPNIYSDAGAGMLSVAAKTAIPLVYVPDHKTNNITVIDPATLKIVAVIPTGLSPQHVVPAYDMGRLWVANNADGTDQGRLTPIDPTTVTGQLAEPRRTPSDPSNGLSASTTALMAGFTVSGSTSASVLCTMPRLRR